MALASILKPLDHAADNTYALHAFDVNKMEQKLAIMAAADATDSPVIMQTSRGARAIANDIILSHLIRAAIELYPHIPVCMHQDHGNSPATCMSAITNGFSSVVMDGSLRTDGKTPSDFQYNVSVTAKVTEMAHLVGVSVEGDLGHLGSLETGKGDVEDGHGFGGAMDRASLVTDPEEAAEFVRLTHVDAPAVAKGTPHGAYKFSRKPDGEILAMDTLTDIHALIPDTHLVMHGSSSVPQELQDKINALGGQIAPKWGVLVDEIKRGIKSGVRKVNIDTDLHKALISAIRKVFPERPEEFDPRKYLALGVDAMSAVCRDSFERFGSAGMAGKIAPVPLP